jgi:tRNA (cmo5U34)-methyltransferase
MQKEEITSIFDRQAPTYDQQWHKMSAINGALHLLTSAVLSELPATARILCVGSGTGAEILYLAQRFPGWHFTAVEPSAPMLEVFRRKAEEAGILSRCVLHAGYVDSLPTSESFDGATAFLVSQFILSREHRTAFFESIARRLRPNGLLVSSDLAGDLSAAECQNLLAVWFKLMSDSGLTNEGLERMRITYTRDVAVLSPADVGKIISEGGFEPPARFFQGGMIHAWYGKRT